MRRKDREVTDTHELQDIINTCKVVRVGTMDAEGMYIIPLNFGYTYEEGNLKLYLHSAKSGRKVTAFAENSNVAIEMDCKHALIGEEDACEYTYHFQSIVGNGKIRKLENTQEMVRALELIMEHQVGRHFPIQESSTNSVNLYEIAVENFTGKWNGR